MGVTVEAMLVVMIAVAMGSFLGTVGARLAAEFRAGGSGHEFYRLMSGRSVCACGARRLGIGELVPLLSAAFSRGRCRTCGIPLPAMEPVAEAAAGIGAAVALLVGLVSVEAILLGAMTATAILLSWIDVEQGLLPDLLLVILAALGVVMLTLSAPAIFELVERLAAIVLGGGSLALLRWVWKFWRGHEALGMGDVKLVAVAGLWVGLADLPILIAIGAGATLTATLARHGFNRQRSVPLGPGLLAALIGTVFWRAIQT